MKIAISAIWYPVTMARYFWDALDRRDDVEVIALGPFTDTWIPWEGGMTLPKRYVKQPHFPLPAGMLKNGKVSPSLFGVYPGFSDIDLWLEVDAGFYLDPKPTNGIVAHVATDPHCLNYDKQRSMADFFFCMQTPYMKEGDFYLPYAYDPTIHKPMEEEKIFDACLVGLHYPQRTQLVDRLRSHGLNVYYDIGPAYEDYAKIINQSKVGLNWSSLQDMNARVWELAGIGACAVENIVPDMKTFLVPEEHYLSFSTVEEAERQVLRALDYDDLRKDIGASARRKVKHHTWDMRIQQILETVGLL